MTKPDTPTLTAALAAVEAELDTQCVDLGLLRDAADDLANALRAVRSSGAVVAVVSREAVEALAAVRAGVFDAPNTIEHARAEACLFMARDILKETP